MTTTNPGNNIKLESFQRPRQSFGCGQPDTMGTPESSADEDERAKDHGFNINFFKRFWRLQRLLFPGVFSLPLGLFGLLLLVALLGKQHS